ncbi:MAG: type II toxin-antitoxin system VapC family toxin [Acidobacteriota bacterium]
MSVQGIVLDASAYLASCLPEESEKRQAHALLDDHAKGRIQLHAPHLLAAEILDGLCKRVRRPEIHPVRISPEEAVTAWKLFQELRITLHEVGDRGGRIIELAHARGWPATYDMVYVALAEHLQAPLVTADPRLAALAAQLPFIVPLAKYGT